MEYFGQPIKQVTVCGNEGDFEHGSRLPAELVTDLLPSVKWKAPISVARAVKFQLPNQTLPCRKIKCREIDSKWNIKVSAETHPLRGCNMDVALDFNGVCPGGCCHGLTICHDKPQAKMNFATGAVPRDPNQKGDPHWGGAGPGQGPTTSIDIQLALCDVDMVTEQHGYVEVRLFEFDVGHQVIALEVDRR